MLLQPVTAMILFSWRSHNATTTTCYSSSYYYYYYYDCYYYYCYYHHHKTWAYLLPSNHSSSFLLVPSLPHLCTARSYDAATAAAEKMYLSLFFFSSFSSNYRLIPIWWFLRNNGWRRKGMGVAFYGCCLFVLFRQWKIRRM